MTHIYVDADGCPVKDEVYHVAKRYDTPVTLVANKGMHTPNEPNIHFQLVDDGFDAADDWIVETIQPNEIVITADIPLAARCLENGAHAIGPKGRIFTQDGIGGALANREVASQMREHGQMTGGPAPFNKKDRSRFLQALDTTIHATKKAL
jgi:uncharacterized protein YaiI (UPF0178 family)